MSSNHGLSFRESYELLKRATFYANNPTPGTGIASKAANSSFSATAGILSIYNGATTSQGSVIIPRRLTLKANAANTNATDYQLIGRLDSINRYSSGGSALTPVNAYKTSDSGYTDKATRATIYFGDLTLAAESDADQHWALQISEAVLADEEILEVLFTLPEEGVIRSVLNNQIVVGAPCIGPGCTFTIHDVAAASDTADAEFEVHLEYFEYRLD